jgi:hypothetical protein
MEFSRIPVIEPYNRGDNFLYKITYGRSIGIVLHNLEIFRSAIDQEKINAFIGLYLFSIISVHIDILYNPRGLDNAKRLKNKMYIVSNTIMHNPIIQKLALLYLEIKLLKEHNYIVKNSDYKNMDQILNLLDDTLIFLIHLILSFNYTKIIEFIQGPHINQLPIMYETIHPDLNIDLLFILSLVNDDIIFNSFYCFDPMIEFNEYGWEIIPEHYEILYGSIVRNFRGITDTKPINIKTFKQDPIKCIDEIELVKSKFIHLKDL